MNKKYIIVGIMLLVVGFKQVSAMNTPKDIFKLSDQWLVLPTKDTGLPADLVIVDIDGVKSHKALIDCAKLFDGSYLEKFTPDYLDIDYNSACQTISYSQYRLPTDYRVNAGTLILLGLELQKPMILANVCECIKPCECLQKIISAASASSSSSSTEVVKPESIKKSSPSLDMLARKFRKKLTKKA